MDPSFEAFVNHCNQRLAAAMPQQIGSFASSYSETPSAPYLSVLKQAINYSLLNGGKRVRPLLVYASAAALGDLPRINSDDADKVAIAVEMIHAYSLIHDDLPAMDDDDLRRGQATCHKAFDEATAILAGDALQTRAFQLLTELRNCDAQTQLELIKTLTYAAGQTGMVGGQAMDLGAVGKAIDLTQLETIHRLKTGALIRAAVAMGACLAGADQQQQLALDSYAEAIGLAFQVQDDIIDIESDTATLGKTQGADRALDKPTYPALLGLDGAKQKAAALQQQALLSLQGFSASAEPLRALANYIVSRNH